MVSDQTTVQKMPLPKRRECCLLYTSRENAVIEGNAAVRRAVLGSKDMELIRLYSDVPEFRQRLHREVIDETYPKFHDPVIDENDKLIGEITLESAAILRHKGIKSIKEAVQSERCV